MISHRLIWEHFWFLGYESDGSSQRFRIQEQLEQLVGERDDDFSLPIGKNFKESECNVLNNFTKEKYQETELSK
ncbi:hypothetical protein MtrunA17_Chr7g0228271 [Medicago truncatula]|uniref:Uncharacterized protein n=1 Tax=Medicago truncatula TaxID=3880 RepID=A0A396GVW8_MEDTR|nr:hypothetical protein MtrunA17_Chr7g0228271 [Medicago truncatula]